MTGDKVFIYQINTWVWLNTLSQRFYEPITLANVPEAVLNEIARPGISHIWLMGIWQRSPYSRAHALRYKHEYRPALPDLTDDDVIGSAYAIYDYTVDPHLGGRAALAAFRARLAARGVRLILDYVPNHVAADHRWTVEHPDYFVRATPDERKRRPADFFTVAPPDKPAYTLAHGRDPYFPGWADTAQLNAFHPTLRAQVIATLRDIATQCDGVRCDMAMLLMNDIFANTWRGLVGEKPATDYWRDIIPAVRRHSPNFLFIAEVYWGKEWDILQQGFDYAYDKTLYDRIIAGNVNEIRQHLVAPIDYQQKLVRFVENHDEPRAFDKLGAGRSFPVATLITTLPGACLLHDGQFIGRKIKLPVQIGRQTHEPEQTRLFEYYLKVVRETCAPIYGHGEFYLFDFRVGATGDMSRRRLLAYGWRMREDSDYRLIVVNLSDQPAFGRLPLTYWGELTGRSWRLHDVIDGAMYERSGDEMTGLGLFVALEPFESHIFRFEALA